MSRFYELYNRFPQELRDRLKNLEQSSNHHPEGNVENHIKLVFEQAELLNDDDLMICALFHDLGKLDTSVKTILADGTIKVSAHDHEEYVKYYIYKYLDLFQDITTNYFKIMEICLNHMRGHRYQDGDMINQRKRKEFESLQYFKDIMKFVDCDTNGKR